MRKLRFAMIGAGFWARYQLAGWLEAGGVECAGVYNRTRAKAEALAREFGIEQVFDDAGEMLRQTRPDFADVVTDAGTHARYTKLAASLGIAVVCQKPMATSYAEAVEMVSACREARVPFYVNENWRWQTPIRELRRRMDRANLGALVRGRIRMVSGFRLFENQPFLRDLEQFVLSDMGSHLLDTARWMFGEPVSLYCQTSRVHSDIRGEDVATVMLKTQTGATVVVEMGYAENHLEQDRFPETSIFVEAAHGSAELTLDYWIRITDANGTHIQRCPPPRYGWADPRYDVVHSSIVPAQANLLAALRGEAEAETSGEDNLKTVRLVFAAYESAAQGRVIAMGD